LDVGCGTGSLSVVMAEMGHSVAGIDLSPAMIERAKAKAAAAKQTIHFQVMNAARPDFPSASFDVIVCRHLLWVFSDPGAVLRHWAGLLRPKGRLILVEGFWSTGAGLHARQVTAMLPAGVVKIAVQEMSHQSTFWGKRVSDERFAVIADLTG
jgi:2-polyprenyl-3-methyl-5-hydroxy-6-metoxy-1,4-benzoquinol methylase